MADAKLSTAVLGTLSVTQLPKVRALHQRDIPFADRLFSKVKTHAGGRQLVQPFQYRSHSKVSTQIRTGWEAIKGDFQTIMESYLIPRGIVIRPAIWGLVDEIESQGNKQIVDRMARYLSDAEYDIKADAQRHVWRGDVAAMSDFATLNGADFTDGFLEAANPGAQTNQPFVGFSKAALQSLLGAQNQYADVANSFSANFEFMSMKMLNRANLARPRSDAGGSSVDHKWWVTPEVTENWFKFTQGRMHYTGGSGMDEASKAMPGNEWLLHGVPAQQIIDCLPVDGAATTADPWSAALIDHNAVQFMGDQGYVNKIITWIDVPGSPGMKIAFVLLAGQLGFDYLGTSGIIKRAQTY